jgi:hypothetical protein
MISIIFGFDRCFPAQDSRDIRGTNAAPAPAAFRKSRREVFREFISIPPETAEGILTTLQQFFNCYTP